MKRQRAVKQHTMTLHTALTPEGDRFVADFTDEAYHEEMTLLEKMINHYCQTGRMLKMEDESSQNG